MDDCLQLLLLAKAVTVALLADEIVLPGQQGQCGLLAIYLTICCSIIGLAVQYYSAESLVSGRSPVVSVLLILILLTPIFDAQRGLYHTLVIRYWWTADWQECFRAESPEVLAPLLGKHDNTNAASSSGSADKTSAKQKKHETETVKALLSMSAVDTPLLMLAFAAGKSYCQG